MSFGLAPAVRIAEQPLCVRFGKSQLRKTLPVHPGMCCKTPPTRPIVKLLTLTGQRLTEIADLRWSEIDFDRCR